MRSLRSTRRRWVTRPLPIDVLLARQSPPCGDPWLECSILYFRPRDGDLGGSCIVGLNCGSRVDEAHVGMNLRIFSLRCAGISRFSVVNDSQKENEWGGS